MKEIIKDIERENFSDKECVMYGLVYPCLLVAVCVLAELLT